MRIGVVVSSDAGGREVEEAGRGGPSWKIHTMAPKVAVRLSRFSTIALTGTSRLPNIRNSSTKVVTTMRAPRQRHRAEDRRPWSRRAAPTPRRRAPSNGRRVDGTDVGDQSLALRRDRLDGRDDRQPRALGRPSKRRGSCGLGRAPAGARRRRCRSTASTRDTPSTRGHVGGVRRDLRPGRRGRPSGTTTPKRRRPRSSRTPRGSRRATSRDRRRPRAAPGRRAGRSRRCRNGAPRKSSSDHARRRSAPAGASPTSASRCQKPSPTRLRRAPARTSSLSTRGRATASSAGRTRPTATAADEDHDRDAGVGERPQEGEREDEQGGQRDGDGEGAEGDRAAGGLHGADDGGLDVAAACAAPRGTGRRRTGCSRWPARAPSPWSG